MARWLMRFVIAMAIAWSCEVQEECFYDEDCDADQYCEGAVPPSCGSEGTEGECVALPGKGDTCGEDDRCASGLVCNHSYDPPKCQPPAGLGGRCSWEHDCVAPLEMICDIRNSPGACAEPGIVAEGERCAEHQACEEGLACRRSGSEMRCTGPGAQGDECYPYGDESPVPVCADGLVCYSPDGPQACNPVGEPGDPCSRPEHCADGLLCFFLEGEARSTCRAPGAAEDRCLRNDQCAEGLVCHTYRRAPICNPPGEEGATCGYHDHCAEGLICYELRCATPRTVGEACRLDSDCAQGLICDTATRTCAEP